LNQPSNIPHEKPPAMVYAPPMTPTRKALIINPDLEAALAKIRDADLVQFADVKLDGPNVRSPSSGETPLHIVATWGDVDSARALLDAGAEIDVDGEEDHTPLHEAIEQGHLEMVRLLISRGADLKRRCSFGDAFDLARLAKHEGIATLFRSIESREKGEI
jgi:ankyrin repeat protein